MSSNAYQFPHPHINGDTMPNEIDINEAFDQQQQSMDAIAERLNPTAVVVFKSADEAGPNITDEVDPE